MRGLKRPPLYYKKFPENMKQEHNTGPVQLTEDNHVHLDGIVTSCNISGVKDGLATARMTLCTVTMNPTNTSNPVRNKAKKHRIMVMTKDVELLQGLREDCMNNYKESAPIRPTSVALDGYLTCSILDGREEPFIMVTDGNIRRKGTLNVTDNNLASIRGDIQNVTYSETKATINVEVKDPNSNRIVIPVVITKKDKPDLWNRIAEQKLDKKSRIFSKGPLVLKKFGDPEKPTCIISLIGNTVNIEHKLRETTRQTAGPAL